MFFKPLFAMLLIVFTTWLSVYAITNSWLEKFSQNLYESMA